MLVKIQHLLSAILSLGNKPVLPPKIKKELETVKSKLSHINDELKTPLTIKMIDHLDLMEKAARDPSFQPSALKKAQNALPRKPL